MRESITTTDSTGLVLTCVSCHTTWEPQDDDPNSFVCPTEGCTDWVLTARLANDPEPSNPPTANVDRQPADHLPGCLCSPNEDEWCCVGTAELRFVRDDADADDDCVVQVERVFPGDDDYTPETATLVAIEPRSGELRYQLRFQPSQVPALIEGLRAAVELLGGQR